MWFNDITQLMMRLNGVKYINNIDLSIIYRINRDTMLLVEKKDKMLFVEKRDTILRYTIFWSLIKKIIMNEYYLIN